MLKVVTIFISISLMVVGVFSQITVSAQDGVQNTGFDDALQCGAELTFTQEICNGDPNEPSQRVDNIITTIVNIISIIVAIVAVIMIIIGGFKYITSNGDSGAVSGAKSTILYAIVGLVVVALAQIIVRFVVNRLTTTSTTGTGG
jgi:uncharacterized membrane protein